MADVADIRARLVATLNMLPAAADGTSGGLTVYAAWPESSPNLPAVIPVPAAAEFDDRRNGLGLDRWEYDLVVMVSYGDAAVAQAQLDTFLAKKGDNSIRALINANRDLGLGDGTDVYVAGMEGYGDAYGREQDLPSIGAKLRLAVVTDG